MNSILFGLVGVILSLGGVWSFQSFQMTHVEEPTNIAAPSSGANYVANTLKLTNLLNKDCIGTDASGLVEEGTCTGGSGGGLGTTTPWTVNDIAIVSDNETLTSTSSINLSEHTNGILSPSQGGLGANFGSAGNGIMYWSDSLDQPLLATSFNTLVSLLSDTLPAADGGTGQDSSGWNGIAGINAGVWSAVSTTSLHASITGNAGTATALADNGANCTSGSYPLGVDEFGAVEDCTSIPAGGGSGNVATSSAETATYVPFWTSTAGTPAELSGGSSGFAWDNTLTRLTATFASTTAITATGATDRYGFFANSYNAADGGLLHLFNPDAGELTNLWISAIDGTDIVFGTDAGKSLVFRSGATDGNSGDTILALTAPGSVEVHNAGSLVGSLNFAALTEDRTFDFPDISGTVCIVGEACDGAGSSASSTLLTDNNTWGGLNIFANASTTLLSGTTAWFTNFIGSLTGNASTATALFADPDDCLAGSYTVGINASGVAQGCTDATTEISSLITTHAGDDDAHHALVTLAGTPDYITIANQVITRGAIVLTTDVSGDLPFANLAQVSANSVLGNITGSTADAASIATSSLYTWNGTGSILREISPSLTTPTFTTNFTFDSVTVTGLSGIDVNVITGTAGTSGHCAEWDANGDLVTAGAACGTGGGGGDDTIFATSTDGQTEFIYTQVFGSDLVIGASATATAPFWFDSSASTTYIGGKDNASAFDATVQLGDDNNGWSLGYDHTDKSFRISSSTALGTNDVLKIDKGGAVTAPFGFLGQASSTIIGNLTVTSLTSAIPLAGAGGLLAEYTGTSCTNQFVRSLNGAGVATCASVGVADLASADFGDFTCNGSVCSLDADTVSTAEMADADHGDFTYSGGVATLDADVVSTAEIADADFGDFSCSGGVCTLDADVVAAAELADADLGDVSVSAGVVSLDADTVGASELADDQILEVHLDATNSANDNQILSFDLASGGFTWVDDQTGSGGGVWPFTPSSYAGVANQSTTTPLWLNGTQLIASTTLAVSGTTTNFAITSITSALPLAAADGSFQEYAGTTCTNQFIRSLNGAGAATCATVGATDVSLAALTAGDGLTAAGTYTGATARTFAIDFTRVNTWTGLQAFGNTTATNATSTNHDVTGLLTFGGVTGSSWSDFCESITGGAGLCDGNDATGAGGGEWPFTPGTYYGQGVQATSTALRLTGTPFSLFSSSTALFQQASTSLFTIGTSWYAPNTGLLVGTGGSAVSQVTNSITVGEILRVTGANTYAWGALNLADTDAITGDLPFTNLAQVSANSVLGNITGSTADATSVATSSLFTWTGTGSVVRETSPTLITPALGTIASGVGTALTALNGENIQDDTIDDDSIDFADITLNDFTFDVGATTKTEFGYLAGVTSAIQTQLNALGTIAGEVWTGVHNFGGADGFEIPNTANGAALIGSVGDIAQDTTTHNLIAYDGTNTFVFGGATTTLYSFTVASTSADAIAGGIIDLPAHFLAQTAIGIMCHVDGGTSQVIFLSDGTNDTGNVTCSTTRSQTALSANNTWNAYEAIRTELGTKTGSWDYLVIRVVGRRTSD